MPELPEVETTVKGLRETVLGLSITNITTTYRSDFHKGKDSVKDPVFFRFFKKSVVEKTITKVERRAKNILISLDSGHTILIHLKMTGHLLYGNYNRKDPFNRHIRLIFTLSNGETLELCDMRKFAKVTLIPPNAESTHLSNLGPEPLEKSFTAKLLRQQIHQKPNGKIKTVLMDQSIISGIGNIYSDEALWRSNIHPERTPLSLTQKELALLHRQLVAVLKSGIDFGGDSMSDYRNIHGERGEFQEKHLAYRKTKNPCSKKGCAGTILRKVIGGRSAHFCSQHQK